RFITGPQVIEWRQFSDLTSVQTSLRWAAHRTFRQREALAQAVLPGPVESAKQVGWRQDDRQAYADNTDGKRGPARAQAGRVPGCQLNLCARLMSPDFPHLC